MCIGVMPFLFFRKTQCKCQYSIRVLNFKDPFYYTCTTSYALFDKFTIRCEIKFANGTHESVVY